MCVPQRAFAGTGSDSPRCRRLLRERRIPHMIPKRRDQRARRATRPGRPLALNKAIYARRNVVERCINRLKQWRVHAMVVVTSIVIWLES